jgi:hypothetical protein
VIESERVVRVPLPAEQIRRMDQLILDGAGGFLTRTEFIREAIESQIVELTYPAAPNELGVSEAPAQLSVASKPAPRGLEPEKVVLGGLSRGVTVDGVGFRAVDEPLFGLHNRDFPSLWALGVLARDAHDGPVDMDDFMRNVTERAWRVGGQLEDLAVATGRRGVTALFPTNQAKYRQASDAFREFAVGRLEKGSQCPVGRGPLFAWRVAAVESGDNGCRIGVTSQGWDLLEALGGLTVDEPHRRDHAEAFLAHVQAYGPADYAALRIVVEVASRGVTRAELVDGVSAAIPGWRDSVASTNASGYVARAREWGLLEARQSAGRYAATEFGMAFVEGGGRHGDQ